jgi:hypothetical protein
MFAQTESRTSMFTVSGERANNAYLMTNVCPGLRQRTTARRCTCQPRSESDAKPIDAPSPFLKCRPLESSERRPLRSRPISGYTDRATKSIAD